MVLKVEVQIKWVTQRQGQSIGIGRGSAEFLARNPTIMNRSFQQSKLDASKTRSFTKFQLQKRARKQ